MKLFKFRVMFREDNGNLKDPVELVQATSKTQAEKLARQYCKANGYRFVELWQEI